MGFMQLPWEAGELFDISPILSETTAVFPGDQPFLRQGQMSFAEGHHLTLSSAKMSLHIGAHADAPIHYHPLGLDISKRDLDYYLGLAQVIRLVGGRRDRLQPSDLEGVSIKAPRVLIFTGSFPDPNCWRDDFTALSPELIGWLADHKVITAGIDTPSIDPANDKELLSHHEVFRRNMAILEGLCLAHVPEGLYELMALPLRIQGGDAAPVRAVLRSLKVDPV